MRIKAILEYDGSKFHGFQKQNTTNQTVTTQIELVLKSIQITSNIVGSGRTDRGVHASNQVIHFDIPPFWNDLNKLKYTLNQKLKYIRFKHICLVDDNFHARFSPKARVYRYVFKTKPLNVFESDYVSHYDDFDEDLLQNALNQFVGKHDFAYFHKTGSNPHSTVREIYSAFYKQHKDYHIIYFKANGFLRSQVRMMVEASMQVAQKKLDIYKLIEQLKLKKNHINTLAPASGLYLARIIY
jgi:tRNA pseudouridine38-40 synthase